MDRVVEFARDYPSKVAALFLLPPIPLGLFNLATGQAGVPSGGAGVFVLSLALAVLAVLLFIAYGLLVRPSRRLIVIIVVWTVGAAVWAIVTTGAYWQLVFDIGLVAACVAAWTEHRVASPVAPS